MIATNIGIHLFEPNDLRISEAKPPGTIITILRREFELQGQTGVGLTTTVKARYVSTQDPGQSVSLPHRIQAVPVWFRRHAS